MYCEYRFNTTSSKKRAVSPYGVQLTFTWLELEDETYCLYDYIEIYDGKISCAGLCISCKLIYKVSMWNDFNGQLLRMFGNIIFLLCRCYI